MDEGCQNTRTLASWLSLALNLLLTLRIQHSSNSESLRIVGEDAGAQALVLAIPIHQAEKGGPGICTFSACLPRLGNADANFSETTLKNMWCACCFSDLAHCWSRFRCA